MRNFLLGLLLAILFVLPVSAQDATPDPPSITIVQPDVGSPPVVVIQEPVQDNSLSPAEIVLIVVIFIVIAGSGYVLHQNKELAKQVTGMAVQLGDSVPPWLWDAVQAGADKGMARLGEVTDATPNTMDDDLFQRLQALEQEVFGMVRRPPPSPPYTPPAPPPPITP